MKVAVLKQTSNLTVFKAQLILIQLAYIVSPAEDKIFVSDSFNGTITCMTMDNQYHLTVQI